MQPYHASTQPGTGAMNIFEHIVYRSSDFISLIDHGCDVMQGYLVSPPVPPEQFERLLAGEAGPLRAFGSAG
jgi:predicted signal transduction protein with EAL and GGDEF domain